MNASMPATSRSYSPPAHQREVDAIIAAIRGEQAKAQCAEPAPRLPTPEPSRNTLDHSIAQELRTIRHRLDQLGDVLASDPVLAGNHCVPLQDIDLTNQVLDHLANVIAAQDKGHAVECVSMRDLKSRLQRRAPER